MAAPPPLEKVARNPGIYRRHVTGCKRTGRCRCPFVVRFKDHQRKDHKQFFATLEDARRFKGDLDGGRTQRRPRSPETVGAYFAHWIENYRGRTARGLEESSRKEYEKSFQLHIEPFGIARTRMRDLAAPDVKDWFTALERKGRSPNTIRKARTPLAAMLADAVEDGAIPANPAAGVRYVPTAQTQRAHARPPRHELTAEDVTAILSVMDPRWQAAFMLLTQTGLRISELLGLRWEHVHLGDDAHILVAEQFYKGQRKRLKTAASMAAVPLSAAMASWLVEIRPPDVDLDAPVFPSTIGSPMDYSNLLGRILRPALRDAGIAAMDDQGKWNYQGIGFHSFRKACGSLLHHHGEKSLRQIQGFLRHAQLTTTLNTYIDQVDGGLGSADCWSEILSEAPPAP